MSKPPKKHAPTIRFQRTPQTLPTRRGPPEETKDGPEAKPSAEAKPGRLKSFLKRILADKVLDAGGVFAGSFVFRIVEGLLGKVEPSSPPQPPTQIVNIVNVQQPGRPSADSGETLADQHTHAAEGRPEQK